MTEKKTPAGCTCTAVLKMIALLFMFIDHSGKMVFGNMTELRLLGRIAFPIYAWCLVVGAGYTRSFLKYAGRLLLLFAISQPLYMVALNHEWSEPNIFLTMAVAVLGLWGLREKKYGSQFWAPVLAIVLAILLRCDYGWKGVLLIMMLWAVRDSRPGIAAVMAAFCLYWGSSSSQLTTVFGIDLTPLQKGTFGAFCKAILKLQGMAILALPFMLLRETEGLRRFRMPKIVGYLIYPLHLVLLLIMEGLMTDGGFALVADRLMGLVIRPVLSLFGA